MKILFINPHGCGPGYGSCCNYSGYPYFPQYLPRACLRQYLCMFCQMYIGQYHNPITFLSVNKVQIFIYLFPGQLGLYGIIRTITQQALVYFIQAGVFFSIMNAKFWLILAPFGFFVTNASQLFHVGSVGFSLQINLSMSNR